ncbi:hypothetical protein EV363DRAFT_1221404 [Boletus edulis]|uniref:Uncharacterized protein n=1 Tax=Boletus edulis BED1 TaxID=1328754 RepID=A0AAD4GM66_BOLED|nr:hypothetical protein EV363DRAFT_1221404 [Boletus edulis]KAF8452513.1 hypothetical protein L210DRAFT_938804 [Boletus edulis BED1]
MASAYADAAGCCGLCVYSALEAWCILHPFGARCCGSGPRGCCGSCCDNSFNEDNFDEQLKKAQAKNSANTEPVDSQPTPSQGMSTATGDPKPHTNDAV